MKLKSLTALLLLSTAGAAFAQGKVSCPAVPKAEKKPQMALQRKLEAEGWKVCKVQDHNNCWGFFGSRHSRYARFTQFVRSPRFTWA